MNVTITRGQPETPTKRNFRKKKKNYTPFNFLFNTYCFSLVGFALGCDVGLVPSRFVSIFLPNHIYSGYRDRPTTDNILRYRPAADRSAPLLPSDNT